MMLTFLVRASLDGAILAIIVWAVCLALPRLSAGARTTLWWLAAAKFLLAVIWIDPIVVRILPAAEAPEARPASIVRSAAVWSGGSPAGPTPEPVGTPARAIDLLPRALLAIWAAGTALSMAGALRRSARIRSIVEDAEPAPEELQAETAALAGLLALRRVPDVRLSDRVETPLVTGLVRPVIVLPAARFAALPDHLQRMALCHEVAHVVRGDLWLGCVPALAERVFFFHPLARIAAREYVFWREAACDAAVLDALGAAPQEYGRLLLDLGISRPQGTLAAAGAAWSFSSLKRRIVMLREPSTRPVGSRVAAIAAIALTSAALVPLRLGARMPAEAVEAPDGAPAVIASSLDQTIKDKEKDPLDKADSKDSLTYVMMFDDNHTTMSGSMSDIKRAQRHKTKGEPLLWFRHQGREYVVRDGNALQRLRGVWEPLDTIGIEQDTLGRRQEALAEQQHAVSIRQEVVTAEQEKIAELQERLSEKQEELSDRQRERASEAERRSIEQSHAILDAEMRKLEEQMAVVDARMREAEEPMRKLDAQMEALDRQMSEMDARMDEAQREVDAVLRKAFEKLIAEGAATVVK